MVQTVVEPISIPASPMSSTLSGIRKPGNAGHLARPAEGRPPRDSCKGRLLQVLAEKLEWPVTVPGKPKGRISTAEPATQASLCLRLGLSTTDP